MDKGVEMNHSEAGRLGGRPRLKTLAELHEIEQIKRMYSLTSSENKGGRLPGLRGNKTAVMAWIHQITEAAG